MATIEHVEPAAQLQDFQVHDDSGALRQSGKMQDKKLHGKFTEFDDLGRTTQDSTYSAGVLHGEQNLYAHGSLRALFPHVSGMRHGSAVLYGASGLIAAKREYAHGVLQGDALDYDDDGNLVGKTPYSKGKREGEAVTYYPSGKVMEKAPYKDDVLDGEVKFYAYDGTLILTKKYEKGKRVDAPAPAVQKPADVHAAKPASIAPKKTFPLTKLR